MVERTSWQVGCQATVLLTLLASLSVAADRPDGIRSRISGCDELVMPRLPERIRPSSYKVGIFSNLDDFSFEGTVKISLEIGNTGKNWGGLDANQIALHADPSLVITKANYMEVIGDGETEKWNQVIDLCRNTKYDLLVVTLKQDLIDGSNGRLEISFAGPIRNDMRGFYRSSYLSPDGELRYAAATQFEPTYARKAFPCFDEPSFKATFELVLLHDLDRMALSNMPVKHEEDIKMSMIGWLDADYDNTLRHLVRFEPTPPMSTYLLAWVVGEFEHLECHASNNRIKIRAHTEPGRKEQSHFALKTACRAVEVLENYFGIEFPLKKIDMVSLNDFAAGAMENWGLITYSESTILVDERHTSPAVKAHVAAVVIHELAHQWFGNLVTMRWWNDLWLNEGFATWVQFNMTEALFPEYNLEEEYVIKAHIPALVEDEIPAARSIAPESLSDNTNFANLFDGIAYEKSASLIRLLNHEHLGPKLFKSAIQHYMKKHQYGNTQTKDLWNAMESVGSQSVQKIMDSWVGQPGHPVVKVSPGTNAKELVLEQERITNSLKGLSEEEKQQKWLIPIGVIVSDGSKRTEEIKMTMNEKNARIELPEWFDPSQESGHWFKLNPNFDGLYRVKYRMDLMRSLRKPIESQKMSPTDRTELISDADALFATNRMSCDELLEVISWYSQEDNGVVLEIVADSFGRLNDLFTHHEVADKLRAFGQRLFEHVYQKFGFIVDAGLGPISQNGRASALTKLIELDHSEATSDALKMFDANVAPVLRPAVYMAVAKHGSDEQYERLFEMYEATHSREERDRLVRAIFQATDGKRLDTAWNWLKRPEVKVDRKLTVLQNALSTTQGRSFVRQLFEQNQEELRALDVNHSMTYLAYDLCIAMGPDSLPESDRFFPRNGLIQSWDYWLDSMKSEFTRRNLIQAQGRERMAKLLNEYDHTS